MVVPIRDLENITQSSDIMSSNSLKVVFDDDIDIVTDLIGAMFNLNNNFDEVRGHSLNTSTYKPRFPFVLLSISEKEYHAHIQRKSNRMDEDEPDNSPDSIKLEYKTQSQNHQVSKVADFPSNTR